MKVRSFFVSHFTSPNRINLTGIFTYIYHTNQLNVGNYTSGSLDFFF